MATTYRVGSPARFRDWGLTVNDMTRPTEYIVLQYLNEGRRHGEPYVEVCRPAYDPNPAVLAERAGMPEGVARKLVSDVEMKRLSGKTSMADQGYRPVR
jgi:hypothetical protein